MRRTRVVAIGWTLLVTIAACGVSPMGRRQLLLLPDDDLDRQGLEAYAQYKRDVPATPSEGDRDYVACVTQSLAEEVESGHAPATWEFTVFEDPTPNAFALPGGKIGVHSGLLDVAETDAQLAAVLGHEMAHVLAQHSNERISASQVADLALLIADATTDMDPQILAGLGLGAHYGLILPYSRAHESEADLIGLDLMARAGFDPREAVLLWRNMEKNASEEGAGPEFLSTHPTYRTRTQDLDRRMPRALHLYHEARARGRTPWCRR